MTTIPVMEAWRDELAAVLARQPLVAEEVRIGVFYTAVRLSTGAVGVAFTPRDLADTVCCPRSAAAGPPAGRLSGASAWDLSDYAFARTSLRRAVGVAALNALSAHAIGLLGTPEGRLAPGLDAIDAAGIAPTDQVAMVGAFTPFIKALKGRVAGLAVVDKHPSALKPDELEFWRPPERAVETLAAADVVLITGSALVEGGLDELLAASAGARCVVLAGPTASPWPPPFFARGVHVLAGVRIVDGPGAMRLVSEAGSGYALFSAVGEKVCVLREP